MILITGSLAYDQIMDFPGRFSEHIVPEKVHNLNVSFLVDSMRKSFGGTAGNIAYTLSLLGIKCALLGLVGDDFAPYRQFLSNAGIDTGFIKEIPGYHTSAAFGITDRGDNQIWGFYTGADGLSDTLMPSTLKVSIDFAVIAPHNPAAMLKYAKEYKKKRIRFLFDPGMQLPWLSGDDLKSACEGATIIIGNDYEVGIMEKKMRINNLHLYFQDKVIITTFGIHGSKVSLNGRSDIVKSAKVKDAPDPAGAGDAYRAGFLAGYLRKFPLITCAQMGSVAASYTVEKYGTTTHKFTISEFCTRYWQNYGQRIRL